ncbi:MAG: hypothetical protein IK137_00565 [Bacilli bacterium]|nr:hypothetical protein [Bacilli bacterium]
MDYKSCNLKKVDEYYSAYKNEMMPYWITQIKKNRDLYNEYKSQDITGLTDEEKKQIKFLSIVDGLGYSMDDPGTHLYKDIIVAAYDEMLGYSKEDAEERAATLLTELQNKYSSFYIAIAHDEYEMGNTVFFNYINAAVENKKPANNEIISDAIFGENYIEESVYVQAFRIALYMARKDKKKLNQQENVK